MCAELSCDASQCSWWLNIWLQRDHCVRKGRGRKCRTLGTQRIRSTRLGTAWEQDWEHWEHCNFSRPSDTAIRAAPLDAPDTATSLAPAGNERHESCLSGSIAPAAC